ncbi:MAG: MerR family transcriptional regulator [Gammaproteobacteria bacterium]|nr:MAG: MerR family transcriptional regulator [Gammaproteobacteria bacterium]
MNERRVVEWLNEEMRLTLSELRDALAVSDATWEALVDEGIVDPVCDQFTGLDLRRARQAIVLHEQLEINWAGVALILELLERIQQLEARLASMGYH